MAPRKKSSNADSMKSHDALDRKILAYAQEKAEGYAQQQKPAPMFGGRWYSLTASACVLMLAVIIIPGQWSSYVSQSKSGPTPLALEEDKQIQLDDAGVAYNSVEQGEPSMSLIAADRNDDVYDEVLVNSEPEAGARLNVTAPAPAPAPAASARFRARSAPEAMKKSVARKNIEKSSPEQKSIEKKKLELKKTEVQKKLYAKRKARAQHKHEPIREKKVSAPKVAELGDAAPAQNDSMPARSHVVEEEKSGRHTSAMMAPTINPSTRKVTAVEEVLVAAVAMPDPASPNSDKKIETLTRAEFNKKFNCQLGLNHWKKLQRVSELWKAEKVSEAKIALVALEIDNCNFLEDELPPLMSYKLK